MQMKTLFLFFLKADINDKCIVCPSNRDLLNLISCFLAYHFCMSFL